VTNRVDLGLKNCECRSTNTFAIIVISIAAIVTLMTTLTSISERSVDAQMMGYRGGGWAGNMTSGQPQQPERNIINNGTINLEQIIFQAINSKINTSLTQAMTSAERSVGSDAFAVAAFGSEESGFFAYRIILATPEMKFYYVKVDPGNGQILDTQEVSQKELDKMHKEHSAMVVNTNDSHNVSVSGFPFIIPH
jgi:hypothetical protein